MIGSNERTQSILLAINLGYERLEDLKKEIEEKNNAVSGDLKTGDIVEIKNAYFKNDNGVYFVRHSPGDPDWCGSDYSLTRLNKNGTLSKSKNNICFWPISIFVNDPWKRAEAKAWNKENASIERSSVKDDSHILKHFEEEKEKTSGRIEWTKWHWGEDHPEIERLEKQLNHYESVIKRLA